MLINSKCLTEHFYGAPEKRSPPPRGSPRTLCPGGCARPLFTWVDVTLLLCIPFSYPIYGISVGGQRAYVARSREGSSRTRPWLKLH